MAGRLFPLSSAAVIRAASPDDAPAAAALLALVMPEFVTTAAAIRHNMSTSPPEALRSWWCAESDGELIGWTSLGIVVETSEEGAARFSLTVHPEHRSNGIGSALADLAEEHAISICARRLHAWSRADGATVSFARSRGFEQTSLNDLLVVDPRAVLPPDPPPGVELLPFTAFDHDPSPIHHVDTVSMLDQPGELTFDEWKLDDWLEDTWSHPLLDHDASVVAVVDGTPAAVTFLQTDRGRSRGTNNGTGTLPEHRGRGLATLAKRASLSRAAGLGVTTVYTGNDVTNAPMQAINRKLGYTPCSTLVNWVKAVVTT